MMTEIRKYFLLQNQLEKWGLGKKVKAATILFSNQSVPCHQQVIKIETIEEVKAGHPVTHVQSREVETDWSFFTISILDFFLQVKNDRKEGYVS